MKKIWSLVFIALFFCGCQNVERPQKPKNLISKEKMAQIISEAYLANAARSVNNRLIIEKGLKLDSLIYQKFNVDSLQFAQSNTYYAAQVNDYLEILTNVEQHLLNTEKALDSLYKVQRKKDSIEGIPAKKQIEEPVRDSLI